MTLRRLVALRHGETDWNNATRMQGHRDIPLNDRGARQARTAAESLVALSPQLIVSSDLSRALGTADIVATVTGVTVRVDERLRETALGQWEGLARAEVQERWPDEWHHWQHRDPGIMPPGGESRIDASARAVAVVEDLATERAGGETVLLVTHGGLIVGLVGRLLGIPDTHWGALTGMANCHWTVVDRHEDRWRLRAYNVGADAGDER